MSDLIIIVHKVTERKMHEMKLNDVLNMYRKQNGTIELPIEDFTNSYDIAFHERIVISKRVTKVYD